MALNLFGVTVNDAQTAQVEDTGTELIAVRDLAAICGPTEYRGVDADARVVGQFSDVVSAFAAVGPVLPAPVGVVFRSSDSVTRWLELHYSALTAAMTFVENRVAARVHVYRPGAPSERDAGMDVATAAAESLRALRRAAVATLPIRADKLAGTVLSAAFLIERDVWSDFALEVDAQNKLATAIRIELTGPWPPYDFIQMQLGA